MQFVNHPLIKPGTIEQREYQINILKTVSKKNTLCVLPTGTGKTNIAILLAAQRLKELPESKVMIVAPTRPLCAQHQKSFQDFLNIPQEDIILVTGKIPPAARGRLYRNADIICATPQTIRNDIFNHILDLSNFSLLVVDETHRAVKKYAYPAVAGTYVKAAKNPLILGLTASPGSSQDKINEICKNLFIERVEIRTEEDTDVRPYIKELDTEFIKVELPEELKKIRESFKAVLKERAEKLKKYNINFRTKRELIQAQKLVSRKMALEHNPIYYHIIALLAETLKLWYILELLETQSIESVKLYLNKLGKSQARSAKRILANEQIKNSILALELLHSSGAEHPKIGKLKEIVTDELKKNKDIKIIIFSHYRNNIALIKRILEPIPSCRPAMLIGQAGETGLSQKEQIDIIRDYEVDVYNCLITSPIGEEGLDIGGGIDLAIFYETVPSEIRTIQRRGRIARTKIGKAIFLITKDTRDEGYFWVAKRKERNMKEILKKMQNSKKLEEFI